MEASGFFFFLWLCVCVCVSDHLESLILGANSVGEKKVRWSGGASPLWKCEKGSQTAESSSESICKSGGRAAAAEEQQQQQQQQRKDPNQPAPPREEAHTGSGSGHADLGS